jgi:hypothetical protein
MIPYTLDRLLKGFRRAAIENGFTVITDFLTFLSKKQGKIRAVQLSGSDL